MSIAEEAMTCGGRGYVGPLPSPQVCCEPKTALKNKACVQKKKKNKQNICLIFKKIPTT